MNTLAFALLLAAPASAEFDRTRPAPLDAARPFVPPRADRDDLSSAARLAVAEVRRLPLAAIEIFLPLAGSALDPRGRPGLAALVASMLDEGTATRTGDQLADELETLGSRIAVAVERDFLRISLFVARRDTDRLSLLEKLDATLELAADMIQRPSFPQEALDRVKRDTIAMIRQTRANPERLADQRLAQAVFGAHPYGRAADEASVAALTREDLRAFHAERYSPSGAVISVNGAVTLDQARELAERHFGSWRAPAAVAGLEVPALAAVPVPVQGGFVIELVHVPGLRQSSIRLGHLSIPRDHPDFFPVVVMNTVLGRNPITSRLGRNLRERRGWTYDIKSSVAALRSGGAFSVSTEVQSDKTPEAVVEILKEIRGLRDAPVPAQELEEQKAFAAGIFVLQHESAQSLAVATGLGDLLGLPPDLLATYKQRLLDVTAAQVQEAARKYLNPDALSAVVVGDGEASTDGGGTVYGGLAAIAPVRVVDRAGRPATIGSQPRG